MPLSWNEIRSRALAFSKHWADAGNEDAQAKPFLIAFFEIFGTAYGYKGAATDAARVAFLFGRYQEITSLLPKEKSPSRRRRLLQERK